LEETFEDDLVESRVGTTGEETVELYEEEEVDVLGGGGLSVTLADVVALQKVDTLLVRICSAVRIEEQWVLLMRKGKVPLLVVGIGCPNRNEVKEGLCL